MVIASSAHAAFHKAAHYFGVHAHKVDVDDDWRADVDAMAARVDGRHRARRRLGSAVPAGRHRPDPGARRARGDASARRCTSTRAWAASCCPFMEMNGDDASAVGLPRRGRHHDLGRHPQARLRAEGRVGARAPHEGAAPLPDVRVRRLARRLLRVAGHAGLPARPADGDRVGGDAPPRHRRLPAPHRRSRSTRRADDRDGVRAIAGLDVLGEPAAQILAIATAPGFEDRRRRVRDRRRDAATRLVPRPPGPARLAARDRQRRQRTGDRRVPRRPRARASTSARPAHARPIARTNYATLE